MNDSFAYFGGDDEYNEAGNANLGGESFPAPTEEEINALCLKLTGKAIS